LTVTVNSDMSSINKGRSSRRRYERLQERRKRKSRKKPRMKGQ